MNKQSLVTKKNCIEGKKLKNSCSNFCRARMQKKLFVGKGMLAMQARNACVCIYTLIFVSLF